MSNGYRAIFRLAENADAVAIAEDQVRSWLRTKQRGRGQLTTSDWQGPGRHQLGPNAVLRVAELDHAADGSRRHSLRFTETNSDGTWEVSVVALSLPQARTHQQTLVITAGLIGVDQEEAIRAVSTPRVAKQLLEAVRVEDGNTEVSAAPSTIRRHLVDDVVDAIRDPDRAGAVVVATSPGPGLDQKWLQIVTSLTKESVGNASVFVVSDDAAESFNQLVPPTHNVPPGRVRTFLPGVDFLDSRDGLRHRVLGPATLERAIRRDRVTGPLPAIHASGIRRRVLLSELPTDVRRSLDLLVREESREDRVTRVEQTVASTSKPTVADASLADEISLTDMSTSPVAHSRVLRRLGMLAKRWLGKSEVNESSIELLDRKLAQAAAESTVAIQQLNEKIDQVTRLELELEQSLWRADDVEIEAGLQAQNAARAEREAQILRSRLIAADAAEATYVEPLPDHWLPPEDLQELVNRITEDSGSDGQPHPACQFVVFTGDLQSTLDIQKRDPVGRYATAFWEFIHTLHDYAQLKAEGGFTGSIYNYLTAEGTHAGHVVSAERFAPRESETVMNRWGEERIFPVPFAVDSTGRVLMDAHFKPTNENTVAPRMHIHDDTHGTGKVYIGYIGKHLTNTKTKDS